MPCPKCDKSTAGKCLEHINEGLRFTEQPGRWVWQLIPICIACGKPSDFTAILPYGTGYDGEHLCSECIKSFVDPPIVRMREKRNT